MDIRETCDARKNRINADDALALVGRASFVIVSKGKRTVRFDMRKSQLSSSELKSVLLGPTGNLRAPALLCGKTLLVGFNELEYTRILV